MELASSDLAAMGAAELVWVSASIPRAAPRTFALLTACLVLPLSLAVLAHTLFTNPMAFMLRIQQGVAYSELPQWLRLWGYQFLYSTVLYTFAALSTAAAVFTVASLYANKPASFSSTLTALPAILPRLLDTFSWVSLLVVGTHFAFALTVFGLIIVFVPNAFQSESAPPLPLSFLLCLVVAVAVFLGIHVYVSALWHLASVISVVEPLSELAALARSKQMLQGRTGTAAALVVSYFSICGVTLLLFRAAVVKGSFGLALPGRLLVGAVLVYVLVCANLLGLLVQSVFYYACMQGLPQPELQKIDRTAPVEHLGGYVPWGVRDSATQKQYGDGERLRYIGA